MLEQINSVFFEEANELLESLEGYLLTLEENPHDTEIISAVFRVMHTIKGSSGMFGFDDVSHFTHEVENTFDMVRSGTAPVTPELINLTLKARDHIITLLSGEKTEETENMSSSLIAEFKALMEPYKTPTIKTDKEAAGGNTSKSSEANTSSSENAGGGENTWRVTFEPSQEILFNGTRPSLIVREVAEMGKATVLLFGNGTPCLSEIDPQRCYLKWNIILTTTKSKNDIEDAFIFVDSNSTVKIEKINIDAEQTQRIGEILVSRKEISQETLDEILSAQKRIGEILIEKQLISRDTLTSALAEQSHIKAIVQPSQDDKPKAEKVSSQSIRVNSEKLDQLVDLVGELVTFNARLGQLSQKMHNPSLLTLSEQSEHLILMLRDNAMDMRMLPIGTIFTRFRRLVHDLASDLHKNIELVTEGAETELDKTVIEKLNDPLIHLIRNAVDHGIETPEIREECGKNPQGTVTLSAQHAGAFVQITISDDGAGLDRNIIFAKAVEKGLIKEDAVISDNEVYELIFQPGFSTSKTVTAVSGRGVGMDVVKRDISALNGTVSINTKKGQGTDFILKIPLTLAIIEGMLVEIGKMTYVIPLANIVECLDFKAEYDEEGKICSNITSRGSLLPYINLRKYFEIVTDAPVSQQVVVVNDQDSKLGLVVDKVIGNYQTVIKPIGDLFQYVEGFSGATILGDGSVALILDIFKLAEIVRTEK